MSYRLEDAAPTVIVYSPQLTEAALLCTIVSFPSGSYLLRTVPEKEFLADEGAGILGSLSTKVEELLAGGLADAAAGAQGVDPSELLYDAVVFTVSYTPPHTTAGTLSATVEIPVNIVDTDTSFGSYLKGGTAQEQLQAAIDKLAAMAGV